MKSYCLSHVTSFFIFGGSHPGLWENGAKAYSDGLGRAIVATGGYKADALRHHSWLDGETPESKIIRRKLMALGIPEEDIFIETKSTNTYENVRYAREIYDFDQVSSILAVCKSYAVGRQVRTLKAQLALSVKVVPYPFDTQLGGSGVLINRENWMEVEGGRAYMFANVLKIHRYGQTGHLVPLEEMSEELRQIVKRYFNE